MDGFKESEKPSLYVFSIGNVSELLSRNAYCAIDYDDHISW